uniref:Uncharacterized protein n=1 Tax=Molossus molossus TaxID=27622 RepID=A0A7J8GLR9_MOLMO|nr:hypothetical protein HJG59_011452 [Molossus molossus]
MALKESLGPCPLQSPSARPLHPSNLQARPHSAVTFNSFHMLGCSRVRKPEGNGSDVRREVAVSRAHTVGSRELSPQGHVHSRLSCDRQEKKQSKRTQQQQQQQIPKPRGADAEECSQRGRGRPF